MTVAATLDESSVKNYGIVAIVVIVLLGLLIARAVTKFITRLVVIIVAVVLAVVIYQQRSRVEDQASKATKTCDISFFGFHVTPSNPQAKKLCQQLGK